MTKEYIEREEALSAIKQAFEKGERPSLYIKSIPAADVTPVVRCQNCMYWTKMNDSAQGRCALFCHYPTGGWYCANGERK